MTAWLGEKDACIPCIACSTSIHSLRSPSSAHIRCTFSSLLSYHSDCLVKRSVCSDQIMCNFIIVHLIDLNVNTQHQQSRIVSDLVAVTFFSAVMSAVSCKVSKDVNFPMVRCAICISSLCFSLSVRILPILTSRTDVDLADIPNRRRPSAI